MEGVESNTEIQEQQQVAIDMTMQAGMDFYTILNVSKTADLDTIKKSYRRLAMLVHPDRCNLTGSTEAFKKVGNAYGTLSDEQKRATYDFDSRGMCPSINLSYFIYLFIYSLS